LLSGPWHAAGGAAGPNCKGGNAVHRTLLLVVGITAALVACSQAGPDAPEAPSFVASNAECAGAPAGTLYVDPRAVAYGDGLSFAEPYRSIREALLYVPPARHVCIAPGTYAEALSLEAHVTLEGAVDPDEPDSRVMLDGKQINRSVTVSATVTLKNLTLMGGSTLFFGAIHNDGGDLTLLDTVIADGVAVSLEGSISIPGRGGGIYNTGDLTIGAGTIISGNSAAEGGGIYNDSTGTVTVVSGARIENNSATGHGGGIYSEGSLTVTSGSSVTGNAAGSGYRGGGVYNAGTISAGSNLTGVTLNTPDNVFDPTP
jgi:predicted outer membrane repeat protein